MSSPVIIAGAGPVGLLLAHELGLAGVATVVLERRTETDLRSPGMAINGAVVELLDQRGLLDGLRALALPLPAAHFSQLWLETSGLEGRHEQSMILPQWRIEQHLEQEAVRVGAEVRRGVEVVALTQDADGVAVTVRSAEGESTLNGSFVVGCDGAQSTVRELAGIGFPGRESAFYGIIGDIEADFADLLPEQFGAHYSPLGGTYAGTPVGPDIWRINTAEFGVAPADPQAPVTMAELNERVLRLTGTEFKSARPLWLTRTGNPTGHAERYRSGRVFLAGDAAHVFFPFNGQRLSTGFQDVLNLGWKLAAELAGRAPEGLLDTYHDERHPVGERVLMNIQAQEVLAGSLGSAGPLRDLFGDLIRIDAVNRYLLEMVMGLGIAYPMPGGNLAPGAADGLLGRRLPHVPLVTDGGESSVPRLLRGGRAVLLDLSGGSLSPGDLSGWSGALDVVVAEPTEALPVVAVLLRPDGHVAWVAESGDPAGSSGLGAALRTWLGDPVK
ncbi:FAD-dependent monooxygenase [Kitasatospora sp. NPDC059408]|uniref:FAD-dependent monooxygenase n=1 Tax=Kitasatospora sp. NPDC059408 TaxID=3346823 RepID=UPI003675B5CF